MFGRKVIYTDEERITSENVTSVLMSALTTHVSNRAEIKALYEYYKGNQPVLNRVKETRPEINNPVVENIAYQIVEFKTGYLVYEPIQYVCVKDDSAVINKVEKLNRWMVSQDKESLDTQIAWWFHICGTSYRMVLPNKEKTSKDDKCPFEIYTLDPQTAFVVRSSGLGNKPVMGVKYIERSDGTVIYSCYTDEKYFEISDLTTIVKEEDNPMGMIPIIEYPGNLARLGAFEIVLSLMDAINEIESNRTDAIQQFVQALLLFHNVDIDSEDFKKLREQGALKFKDIDPQMKAEIMYLVQELNQDQSQTFVDSLYQRVLNICGMPNRNGGGKSTSDTGKATALRDGWTSTEYCAKLTERCFRNSERDFLKLILKICANLSDIDLDLTEFEIRMPRRNYDNIKEKADVLNMMLGNDKIAPKLAFEHCGMFIDPETAYKASEAYAKQREAEVIAMMNKVATGGKSGSSDTGPYDEEWVRTRGQTRKTKTSSMKDGDGDGIINE